MSKIRHWFVVTPTGFPVFEGSRGRCYAYLAQALKKVLNQVFFVSFLSFLIRRCPVMSKRFKKKWKQLSKLDRVMIIYMCLLNVVALSVQFFSGYWFSWWMAGIGNGAYICFLMNLFGGFGSHRSPTACPALDCLNFNCHHFDKDCLACEFTEVSGDE